MIVNQYRRITRARASFGVFAALTIACAMPAGAQAQGYWGGSYGYGAAPYGYGGYAPYYAGYGAYHPGVYFAPQPHAPAEVPPVVYFAPRLRYRASVSRVIHHTLIAPRPAVAGCSCAMPRNVTVLRTVPMPVAIEQPSAMTQPPVKPSTAAPSPLTQAGVSKLYEPRPSAGD